MYAICLFLPLTTIVLCSVRKSRYSGDESDDAFSSRDQIITAIHIRLRFHSSFCNLWHHSWFAMQMFCANFWHLLGFMSNVTSILSLDFQNFRPHQEMKIVTFEGKHISITSSILNLSKKWRVTSNKTSIWPSAPRTLNLSRNCRVIWHEYSGNDEFITSLWRLLPDDGSDKAKIWRSHFYDLWLIQELTSICEESFNEYNV